MKQARATLCKGRLHYTPGPVTSRYFGILIEDPRRAITSEALK